MLDKIIKNIEQEGEKEKQAILNKKEEALLNMERDSERELKEKKEKELSSFKQRIEKEIQEEKQRQEQENSFQVQKQKQKIVKKVYIKAEKKIKELPDKDFLKIVKELHSLLPSTGEIMAGIRTAKALSLKGGLEQEGLFFKSKDLEIDLSMSQVLHQLREKTDPKVIEILFYA